MKTIILSFMLVLLLLANASAFEFDNVKEVLTVSKTQSVVLDNEVIEYKPLWEKYPPIEIKNNYGAGETLFKGVLTEHTDNCGGDCSSIIDIYMANDGELVQDISFFKKYGKTAIQTDFKTYKIFINDGYIDSKDIVYDSEYVCIDGKTYPNLTIEQICETKITGSHYYQIPIWKDYKIGDNVKAGKYKIKIEGSKSFYDVLDWRIKTQGQILSEWADWGVGGTITYLDDYVIHTYYTNGTFNVTSQNVVTVLLVAGGGAGGASMASYSGGGGGGGVVYHPNYTVSSGNYNIIVGSGGGIASAGTNKNGSNSSFNGLVAVGGGGGGSSDGNPWGGSTGGSGGGSANSPTNMIPSTQTCYSGSTCYGTYGGAGLNAGGAGGGGASQNGFNVTLANTGANGGNGTCFNLNGTNTCYGGGGGGAGGVGGAGLGGFLGGGGKGSAPWASGNNVAGTNTLGGGGGGSAGSAGVTGGSGVVIIRYTNPSTAIRVAQQYPPNNFATNNTNVSFYCNSSADVSVDNMTLHIPYPYINKTFYNTSYPQTTMFFNYSYIFDQGLYTWSCTANDATSSTTSASWSFTVDYTPPIVNFVYPSDHQEFLTKQGSLNVTFAGNATHHDGIPLSSCYYYQPFTESYVTCGQNFTYNLSKYDSVDNIIAFFANDTTGNYGSDSVTVHINIVNDSLSRTNYILTEQPQTILLYLNASNLSNVNANLTYNGTIYSMTEVSNDGQRGLYSAIVTTPYKSIDTNVTLYSNYSINGNRAGTNIYYQYIYTYQNFNFTDKPCSNLVYNFTLFDEQNLTGIINGTIEYNFYYGSNNQTSLTSYGKITDTSSLYLCANFTISPNWTIGIGEIVYYKTDYAPRRYYIFNGTVITNTSSNINLYDLATTASTSYLLTVESTSLLPYTNKYVRVLRWYPDLNEYKTVEMSKTDDKGQTVIHVKTEDVDYRIGVYEPDGTLIKLASPIRMLCLTSPCSYSLKVSPTETDYISFLNIDYTFNFNATTNLWTFVYSDSSGETNLMNLTVYWVNGNVDQIICNNYVSASVGSLTCNTTGYSGVLKGIVTRSASPPIVITQKIVNTVTTAFKSTWGLWLSLLLALPIILIFAMISPVVAIVGGVVALIPALYFGSINIAIFGGIVLLAGIVIHFMRRIS